MTTVPAAKRALIALWQATPGLAGVAVTWGSPVKEEHTHPEHVFLDGTELDDGWRALGNQRRQEEYRIAFQVRVSQYGDDEQAAEERAWALYEECKEAMRVDPTLGGAIRQFGDITVRQTNQPMPEQWGAVIRAVVTCQAFGTP